MPDCSKTQSEPKGHWLQWLRVCVALVSCGFLAGSTGCAHLWTREPSLGKADPPLSAESTAEQILARVNQNTYSEYSPSGLHSFRSDDITVRMSGVPASMRASMVVEAPRNLRLRVAHPVTGGEAVDIGSNDEKFWVWMKESPQRNVITCSHDHVAMASKVCPLPLPFRPDWLMEVLGVIPISGSGYEVHRAKARSPIVELVSIQKTPDHVPVRRIVKINTVYGVVTEHRVESVEGKMIAKASLFRHFRDPATKLILPRQINIDWPIDGQPIALSLEFKTIAFNSPAESVAMWTPPDMPGFPELDIGLLAMQRLGKTEESIAQTSNSSESPGAGKATLDSEDHPVQESPFYDQQDQEVAQPSEDVLDRIDRPVQSASNANEPTAELESESESVMLPPTDAPSLHENGDSDNARPFPDSP